MLLILLSIALILGIAFYQALQGMFSSLIMAILTLVCVLLAFDFYEPLAVLMAGSVPAAEPISLMVLLILPLFTLRLLVDQYLGVNLVPPVWVDRVGGGVFGLITSLLLVGTLLIAIQMLPFDRAVLGYDAYSDELKPNSMPLNATGFTLGTVKFLSAGSMSDGGESRPFASLHDNLVLELWGSRNRLPGAKMEAPADSLAVLGAYDISTQPFVSNAPAYPASGATDAMSQVVLVRAAVSQSAADSPSQSTDAEKQSTSNQDNRSWWRLRGTQFRLVTEDGKSYYPVGYLMNAGTWQLQTETLGTLAINRPTEEGKSISGLAGNSLPIDLVYRIPCTGKGEPRKPSYLVFRRNAKAEIPALKTELPGAQLAIGRKKVQGQVKIVPAEGAANMMFFDPQSVKIETHMPVAFRLQQAQEGEVTTATGVEAKLTNLKFASGRIRNANEGSLNLGPQTASAVSEFVVPKGYKLAQVLGTPPRSEVRQSLPIMSTVMQPRLRVTLPNGQSQDLPYVGGWARWQEGAGTAANAFVHLYYMPDQSEQSAVLDPELRDAYSQHLKSVSEFGLLFLVPEGSTILGVQLSGGASLLGCESPLEAK